MKMTIRLTKLITLFNGTPYIINMAKATNLLTLTNIQPPASPNLALTVTSPTYDLTSNQYIAELIHPHTSYQTIPSTPKSMVFDVEDTLLKILPLSKFKLIDIALPFFYQEKDQPQSQYYGRYLIFNQRLIGIRLCSSKKKGSTYFTTTINKWPTGQTISYRTPKCFIDYYRQNKLEQKSYKRQILVGDFILSLNNIKIGLLFESQAGDIDQTLHQYRRLGCNIISVVCDVPRQATFQNNLNYNNFRSSSPNQNILKRFGKQYGITMMYSCSRMAPLSQLYLSRSFIIHKELPEKLGEPYFFNDGGSLTTICAINQNKQHILKEEIQTKAQEEGMFQLFIEERLKPVKSILPGKTQERKAFTSKMKKDSIVITKDIGDFLKKLQIWYLFKQTNQSYPFTFSVPLTTKTTKLFNQIKSIANLTGIDNQNLVQLYKANQQYQPTKTEQSMAVTIHQNIESLLQNQNNKLFIYSDDGVQMKFLNKLAQSYDQIQLCHNLIPFQQPTKAKKIEDQKYKRLDSFTSDIIKNRTFSFKKIIIQAMRPTWKLNKQQIIEAVTKHLKIKLRSQIQQHPFYTAILKKTNQQIERALEGAQIELINDNDKSIGQLWERSLQKSYAVVDVEETSSKDQKDKDFWVKLKEQKKIQSQQMKKTYITCHRCMCHIEKPFIYRCNECRTEICYICIQSILRDKIKSRSQYLQCLVCKKICGCAKCRKSKQEDKDKIIENQSICFPSFKSQISINTPIESEINNKQAEAEAAYKESCTLCLIMGRTPINIKVHCLQCDAIECLLCIRQKQKNVSFAKKWLCQKCRPVEPKLSQKRSENIESTPYQNVYQQFLNTPKHSSKKSNSRSVSRSKSPKRKQPERMEEEKKNDNFMSQDRDGGLNYRSNSNYENRGYQNNRGGQFRGRGRGRGRGGFNNDNSNYRPNTFYDKGNNNNSNNQQAESKKSRSASKSKSPVRKINNQNNQKKSASVSRSISPPRNKPNLQNKKLDRRGSPSASKSPIRNKPTEKALSPKRKSKSLSRSQSPPKRVNLNNKSNYKNEKKCSPSRSISPPKNKASQGNQNPSNKRKQHSKSVSRSKSPVRNKPQSKKRSPSISRSRSKSRDRSRDKMQDNKNKDYNQKGNYERDPPRNEPQKPLWGNNKKFDNNRNFDNNRGGQFNKYSDRNNSNNYNNQNRDYRNNDSRNNDSRNNDSRNSDNRNNDNRNNDYSSRNNDESRRDDKRGNYNKGNGHLLPTNSNTNQAAQDMDY